MAPLQWSPALVTHATLDDDHRELIEAINKLEALKANSNIASECEDALFSLISKTQNHAKKEEGLMHKAAYNRFITHKIEHEQFISRLKSLAVEVRERKTKLSHESLLFIHTWLYEHIVTFDKHFASWLHKKGINNIEHGS